MRDFETLRAEVYRRSEEKITKIRKTRRRIIAVCLPLMLCVTAVCLFPPATAKNAGTADWLPIPEIGMADRFNPEQEAPMANAGNTAQESILCSDIRVEVMIADGTEWTSTDTDTILDLSQALHRITGPQEEAHTPDDFNRHDPLSPDSYRIVFTDRDGNRFTYLLTPDSLQLPADGQTFAVTPAQYEQLQSLLTP